jgi:hypothetical protein
VECKTKISLFVGFIRQYFSPVFHCTRVVFLNWWSVIQYWSGIPTHRLYLVIQLKNYYFKDIESVKHLWWHIISDIGCSIQDDRNSEPEDSPFQDNSIAFVRGNGRIVIRDSPPQGPSMFFVMWGGECNNENLWEKKAVFRAPAIEKWEINSFFEGPGRGVLSHLWEWIKDFPSLLRENSTSLFMLLGWSSVPFTSAYHSELGFSSQSLPHGSELTSSLQPANIIQSVPRALVRKVHHDNGPACLVQLVWQFLTNSEFHKWEATSLTTCCSVWVFPL